MYSKDVPGSAEGRRGQWRNVSHYFDRGWVSVRQDGVLGGLLGR